MATQYRCGTDHRRQAVLESTTDNGIDYLEVGTDQTTLLLRFLRPLPLPPDPRALTVQNVVIEGGVRFRFIQVDSVTAAGHALTVAVTPAGDFSTYRLRLRSSDVDDTPEGYDARLSEVEFSFKVDCPSEFDCLSVADCPPDVLAAPEIDYLAKDYASFRRLMLDRMSVVLPGWQDRNPADLGIALVELLAYVGDHLSYFQDAVGTEAYLGTALKRISLRRHARLLDYAMHDGSSARTWICVEVRKSGPADGATLPQGTKVLSRGPGAAATVPEAALATTLTQDRPVVFETITALTLHSAHNRIRFHTWGEDGCCLPAGATRATLVNDPPLALGRGSVLVVEEVVGPVTGAEADADPAHRQAVRLTEVITHRHGLPLVDAVTATPVIEVSWHDDDALTFPLCVSVVFAGGTDVRRDVSVARGNVALADHGRTVGPERPVPDQVPDVGTYRPRLDQGPLTFVGRPPVAGQAAAAASAVDPRKTRPAILQLRSDDGATWTPRQDLLGSDRFATDVVAELDEHGRAHLRFGDDEHARRPPGGMRFRATYRIGNGTAGNVGAEALTRLVRNGAGIDRVRNPMPAVGGRDPEPMDAVRLFAPEAFRTQQRAVTEDDYARVTERLGDVQKAAATLRWTGSWHTAFVTVDRFGGRPVDAEFEARTATELDLYRMAGTDVEIDAPVLVPLDLELAVCVAPGYLAADVKRAVLDALGARVLPGGRRGFFHADNFTFGQPVFLSQLYAAVLEVPGVASVEATRFQRWGAEPQRELEDAVLRPGRLEVVQLENDPSLPESGRLELVVAGGS